MLDNLSQIVIDSKEEVVKKKYKYVARRKERLVKLYAFIKSFLFPCLKSSPFLSLYSILAPMFGLMLTLIPTSLLVFILTLVFCLESFAVLLFCYVPTPAISAAFFLPCHTFVFCCGILALLLPLFMLSLLLFLGFLTLKILK